MAQNTKRPLLIIIAAVLLTGCSSEKDTGSSDEPQSQQSQLQGPDQPLPEARPTPPSRVEKLFDGGAGANDRPYQFPNLIWQDIPELMQRVGKDSLSRYCPVNKESSIARTEPAPEGIVAGWLIEGILIGGDFPSLAAMAMIGDEGTEEFSIDDVAKVSAIYRAWWEKAKDMSPEQAREISPKTVGEVRWR